MTATEDTPPRSSLHIEADLTVGLTSSTVRIHSEAETLYVEARSFEALSELRAAVESDAVGLFQKLADEMPFAIGTPVVVRVRGVRVGSYQPGEPAGRLAEALDVAPFDVEFGGVLRAVGRRLRPPK